MQPISSTRSGPRRRGWVLGAFHAAGVALAMLAAVCIELGWQDGLDYLSTHHVTVSASWGFFWIALGTAGLFDSDRPERIRRTLVAASVAVFGGMLLVAAFLWVTPWQFAHPILLVFGILALAAALAMGWIHGQTRRARFMTSRCLVIGTNGEARRVIDLIHRYPRAGLELIGLVHCGKGLERPGQLVLNYPVLGTDAGLPEMIRFHRIDTVIVAAPGEVEAPLLRRLRSSRYRGVAVADYVSLYEELAQEIPVDAINDEWLFAASMNSSRPYMRHFKRAFDVIASIVALTLAAPLVGIAAVLVALDSPGPILYRQERLGRDGVPFTILKFRTMAADAEGRTGPVWATANDPRVTRVGRWLRRFRIDEIPQLINVLRGEMSVIGPRPERQLFVTQLHEQIPFYAERAMVRPGISGWAQVRQPYAASIDDSRRKLQADLYYIKHMSLTTDLYIILKTIKIVLLGPAPSAPRPERTPSSRVSPHGSPAAPRVTFANPMRNGNTRTGVDASAQARWN